jgi:hypothetical protein
VGQQLYRRVPQAFVEEILEAFNDRRMTERQACALSGPHVACERTGRQPGHRLLAAH